MERHQAGCAYARGRRRCVDRAQVRVTARGLTTTATRTLAALEEATAWRLQAREEARRTGTVAPAPEPAPALAFDAAAKDFSHGAAGGRALTRARKPYSRATLVSYESALRLHVLPRVDERRQAVFETLPADAVDGRALQSMVNAITTEASPALARVADAT